MSWESWVEAYIVHDFDASTAFSSQDTVRKLLTELSTNANDAYERGDDLQMFGKSRYSWAEENLEQYIEKARLPSLCFLSGKRCTYYIEGEHAVTHLHGEKLARVKSDIDKLIGWIFSNYEDITKEIQEDGWSIDVLNECWKETIADRDPNNAPYADDGDCIWYIYALLLQLNKMIEFSIKSDAHIIYCIFPAPASPEIEADKIPADH